jgi:class 3 adenylate cyclase
MDDINQAKILIVEDAETNIDILLDTLAEDYEISVAIDGETALEILEDEIPDLILLDIIMPGIDGYETCRRIKEVPKTQNIPIIFITGKTETQDMIQGFQVGGVDYITKPFHKEEVSARIRNHLELQFLRKANEERMKATMARYMGSELVETLTESGQEVMGTSNHEATILFSDIRGFTSLTEKLGAPETVAFLNRYFSLMVDCLHQEKGMLDKFIGDAIMAVFGVPFPYKDHADRGLRAAISMINVLKEYNITRQSNGEDPINIGIGLNSAPVVSGNIGSEDRMDYTVIGDGVNTAARIESICKYYGARIIICEYTEIELSGNYHLRELDRVYFKGKSKPRRIYEVLDHHTEKTFPHEEKILDKFNAGLQEYREKNWDKAQTAFQECLNLNPDDRPSQIYIERCQKFSSNPPDYSWEGIWELESK